MDLWSQMDFLEPEILGQQSFYAFRTKYAVLITASAAGGTHKFQKIVKFKNLKELGKLVSPHSYRILKKDCLDLPDKIFTLSPFLIIIKFVLSTSFILNPDLVNKFIEDLLLKSTFALNVLFFLTYFVSFISDL